ncbi:unnamed protein product [Thelazia callipaeda]|uniref:SSD domain-containing protein n=1 Tax=Thelazia callipaeda TaxID=103827 RepID=A0A0N5CSL0_THECL|nr:unnamed protein product [Thelazia callipaeda]
MSHRFINYDLEKVSSILIIYLGYSKFTASLWAEFFTVAILAAYLYAGITGIQALYANFDAKMLLPPDSKSIEGVQIMNEIVWPDYLGINYIMRKPPNFSNPLEYRSFMAMVKEIEASKNSLGAEATMHWVKDYLRYLANPSASKLDVIFGISGPEANDSVYLEQGNLGLDMSQFDAFISTDPYIAWKSGIRYNRNFHNQRVLFYKFVFLTQKNFRFMTEITSMLLMIGYNNITSLASKAEMLRSCREICVRYAEYDMAPFGTDAELVDVILSVPSTTANTVLFTIGATGVVFFIFSLNFIISVLATLCVISICTGVIGFLQILGCFLDPFLMATIIISAGLSVDYAVHILINYLKNDCSDKTQRINASFEACALPLLQAGLSTFLVMFPVLFSPVGIYSLISKAVLLTVIFGLFHGLFVMPVILTFLPVGLTRGLICYLKG